MAASLPSPIVLDVNAVPPDALTIDTLARLQLAARRLGTRLELRDASHQLRELIDLVGLSDVLRVEARGQAEQRKQLLRVEEERELDDPTG